MLFQIQAEVSSGSTGVGGKLQVRVSNMNKYTLFLNLLWHNLIYYLPVLLFWSTFTLPLWTCGGLGLRDTVGMDDERMCSVIWAKNLRSLWPLSIFCLISHHSIIKILLPKSSHPQRAKFSVFIPPTQWIFIDLVWLLFNVSNLLKFNNTSHLILHRVK